MGPSATLSLCRGVFVTKSLGETELNCILPPEGTQRHPAIALQQRARPLACRKPMQQAEKGPEGLRYFAEFQWRPGQESNLQPAAYEDPPDGEE